VQRAIRTITVLVTIASLLADSPSCAPEGDSNGDGANDHGNQSLDCTILKSSAPFEVEGPSPDGANFYWFTSRAEGDVSCTGKVAQISMAVVFHHSTNGEQGAFTGPTRVCYDKAECIGRADYRRQRLYCYEVYHYDDYAQVTGWFKTTATSPQTTFSSKEGWHRTGTSYKPRQAGCR
jgi:hypothetical protein